MSNADSRFQPETKDRALAFSSFCARKKSARGSNPGFDLQLTRCISMHDYSAVSISSPIGGSRHRLPR
jgi:hypothetical protein